MLVAPIVALLILLERMVHVEQRQVIACRAATLNRVKEPEHVDRSVSFWAPAMPAPHH